MIVLILWHTSIRIGTLRAIDVDDIDFDENLIEIRNRPESGTRLKNGKPAERTINIAEYHLQVIADYVQHNRHDVTDDHDREPLITSVHGRLTEAPIGMPSTGRPSPVISAGAPTTKIRMNVTGGDATTVPVAHRLDRRTKSGADRSPTIFGRAPPTKSSRGEQTSRMRFWTNTTTSEPSVRRPHFGVSGCENFSMTNHDTPANYPTPESHRFQNIRYPGESITFSPPYPGILSKA